MKEMQRYLDAHTSLLFRAIEQASSGFYLRRRTSTSNPQNVGSELLLSQQLLKSLGYEPHEDWVSLAYWESLLHPDDLSIAAVSISEATDEPMQLEYRLKRSDGTYRWTREVGRVLHDEDGALWLGALTDIDAEKVTSAAFALQRYEVQTILETIPIFIWVKDADGRILQVNRAAAEATGLSKEEIVGRLTADVYPIDAKRYAETDQTALAKDQVTRQPELLHGQSGQRRSMLIDKYKLERPGGIDRILVVGSDVTEIEEARQQLAASEEQFRLLFDSAPVGMLLIDSEGRVVLSNDRANRMFGYEDGIPNLPADALVPQPFSGLTPQSDVVSDGEQTEETDLRKEFTGRRRDGTEIVVEVSLTELSLNEQAVTLASVSDITQRVADEQRLNLAIEAGSVGFWEYVVDSGAVVMSRQALSQIGQAEQWTDVEDLKAVLHPDDTEETLAAFQDYLSGESPEYDRIFRLRHTDGTYRAFLSRGRLVKDEVGNPKRVVGFHIDITDQQATQEELSRSNYELDRFAYVASHDLKAPLRRIFHLAEWAEEDSGDALPEVARTHLSQLMSQVGQMNRLLDDLLAYSRVARSNEDAEQIDLHEVVPELFRFLAPPEHVKLEVEGQLPVLTTARSALEQVLRNLMANAIQHAGTENPTVSISFERQPKAIRFCVQDFGKGIDPKHHDRIFELFQSLNLDTGSDNTGMGLALVRRLCERFGGEVWVESSLGEGSRFYFTWPT